MQPAGVPPPRPGVAAAGRLAQRDVGLDEELRVLPAVRGRELFQETRRVDVRREAGGPFRPVRGPVEVQVAVLEQVVLAARHPVRRCRRAGPVVARVGSRRRDSRPRRQASGVVAVGGPAFSYGPLHSLYIGLPSFGSNGLGLIWSLSEVQASQWPVSNSVLMLTWSAPQGLMLPALAVLILRLEVERRARAVGRRGGLEAVGRGRLHEAALMRRQVVHDHLEGVTTSRRGRVGHVER